MKRGTGLLIFVLIILEGIGAKPYYGEKYSLDGGDNNFTCYHVECPTGTVACKRLKTTSKDGSKLITEVECQDEQGTALDTLTKEEANPFDRATKFTSYSFTGHYQGGLGRKISHNNNVNRFSTFGNENSEVEEFFK